MKGTPVKTFAMLVVALLVAGPVLAQPAGAVTPPAPKAAGTATVEARVDQRITRMHQQLKITSEQETAWNAFAQVMRTNVTSTDEAYKKRSESLATMTAPDNMTNFAQIEQARAQGVENLATSFQALYNTMSDDQKKAADAMFRHYGNHGAAHKQTSK
ncbi:Spy/CpxP family protein refolding chaperone [Acidisphaera sp. S103]|uniref:Spy/CpxP family protein refolding chaperone n=1 Tax=Acidisphaera sp. S103 TaxID=1747223 RepID=UPI00131A72E9|nr:Spy/CpxP family protein refolding chaperone [Acidisphaera sp. S103]